MSITNVKRPASACIYKGYYSSINTPQIGWTVEIADADGRVVLKKNVIGTFLPDRLSARRMAKRLLRDINDREETFS